MDTNTVTIEPTSHQVTNLVDITDEQSEAWFPASSVMVVMGARPDDLEPGVPTVFHYSARSEDAYSDLDMVFALPEQGAPIGAALLGLGYVPDGPAVFFPDGSGALQRYRIAQFLRL